MLGRSCQSGGFWILDSGFCIDVLYQVLPCQSGNVYQQSYLPNPGFARLPAYMFAHDVPNFVFVVFDSAPIFAMPARRSLESFE